MTKVMGGRQELSEICVYDTNHNNELIVRRQ